MTTATANGKASAAEPQTGTRWPDLWRRLAAEFGRDEVKQLTKGKTLIRYITARTAMNRLDSVLGPENWWDEYTPGQDSVMCRLTLRLPDGQLLTKCDAGGYAGMADAGDDDKSGFSDAFKRAAAKFGVARYLYRDGVPEFGGPVLPSADPPPQNNSGHGRGQYASPRQVAVYEERLKKFVAERNARWLDEWTGKDGAVAEGIADLLRPEQVNRHLLKWGLRTGRLAPVGVAYDPETGKPTEDVSSTQSRQYVAIVFAREPEALAEEVESYAREKAWEARQAWREKYGPPDGEGEAEGRDPGED